MYLFRIDTPGVIQRVSRLFHGNAPLIQGFNTFLPLGYRIDVSADPLDDMITVTTPSGTTTQSTTASTAIPRLARDVSGLPTLTNTPTFPVPPPILPALGPDTASRSHTPHTLILHGQHPPFEPVFSPGFQNPQTAAASVLGNLNNNNRNPIERQPPGEFSHAILYLNKIKARYADDANTYKQFLDILQTYQKEQRHLHDVGGNSMFVLSADRSHWRSPKCMYKFNIYLKMPRTCYLNSKTSFPMPFRPVLDQAGFPFCHTHLVALGLLPSLGVSLKHRTQVPRRNLPRNLLNHSNERSAYQIRNQRLSLQRKLLQAG